MRHIKSLTSFKSLLKTFVKCFIHNLIYADFVSLFSILINFILVLFYLHYLILFPFVEHIATNKVLL